MQQTYSAVGWALHMTQCGSKFVCVCVFYVLQFQVEEEGREGFTKEVSMTWRVVLDVGGEKCTDLRAGRKGSPPTCQQIILTHSSWHFWSTNLWPLSINTFLLLQHKLFDHSSCVVISVPHLKRRKWLKATLSLLELKKRSYYKLLNQFKVCIRSQTLNFSFYSHPSFILPVSTRSPSHWPLTTGKGQGIHMLKVNLYTISNCCSCCVSGQCNTFGEKCYLLLLLYTWAHRHPPLACATVFSFKKHGQIWASGCFVRNGTFDLLKIGTTCDHKIF